MNILFVETSINPNLGGIERVTYTLSREFEKNGNSCYYAYAKEDYDEICEHKKIKIDYSGNFVKLECKLLNFIRNNNINIIINQDLYSKNILNFYRRNKEKLGFKLINCFHLSPNFYEYQKIKGKKHKLKYWFYKCFLHENLFVHERNLMYDICDNFVLLSESFIEDFKKRYRIGKGSKLTSIPNPLSFVPNKIDITSRQKIVLIVTRFFEIQKNIKSALRIWKKIEQYGIHDWKLEIVGYGQDENMLREYAKQINITNYEFKGKSDNVYSYYEHASIFMMTSNYEGFGMTILESQSCGCVPIVMDKFSVLHDLITDNVNGVIGSIDEAEYAKQLVRLISNENLRTYLAQNAIISTKRYASDKIYEMWQTLINSYGR